ncbi:hypothetical protein ONE63_010929 [Megalurothrips usitatus]|uniref:Ig-like domain-containing protein n=1 Tax=Megalurothrips usitatus TaxID=439358 RepID=A0AAV7XEH7_9NEOP|nr:hypothetical protein ONE63_010929 [Megalurothrips usitatus]
MAAHLDATYLQPLYWDFNGTFHLSKFDDFDHTAFDGKVRHDDLNELKATTPAPPWLPKGPDKGKSSKELPQFDSNLVTNVTVQLGENAYLRCRVRNLGEHKVSRGSYSKRGRNTRKQSRKNKSPYRKFRKFYEKNKYMERNFFVSFRHRSHKNPPFFNKN